MRKLSYTNSIKKREVQNKILPFVSNGRVCALGGPDIDEYVSLLKTYGFGDITIFENDKVILLQQLYKFPQGITLMYKNILEHLNRNCYYDLDFCFSIQKIMPRLKKIVSLQEYSLTLSVRPIGTEKTVAIMKEYDPDIKYMTYQDTTPMITFYKVSKSIT